MGVRFGGTSFSTFFDTWNHVAKSGVVSKCLWGGSPLQDIGVAKRGRSFEPLFGVLLAEAKTFEGLERTFPHRKPEKKVGSAAGVPAISSQGGWDQHLSLSGRFIPLPCSQARSYGRPTI